MEAVAGGPESCESGVPDEGSEVGVRRSTGAEDGFGSVGKPPVVAAEGEGSKRQGDAQQQWEGDVTGDVPPGAAADEATPHPFLQRAGGCQACH